MRVSWILLISPALLANASPSVGFKGFVLGQSLDDARKVSIAPGAYGPKRLICSTDPQRPRPLAQSESEVRAGIVLCRVFNEIGGSTVAANIELGDGVEVSNEFKFLNNKLFFVYLAADVEHEFLIASALQTRFGPPSRETTEAASNGFGATVDKRIREWSLDNKLVRFAAPDLNIRRLTVTYTDQALEALAKAALASSSKIEM